MRLNLERVRQNVRAASTEDLLDRATVYRPGMEPAALEIIEDELRQRGVSATDQAAHGERRRESGAGAERCAHCARPATWRGWRWHRLFGLLPLFPAWVALCQEHAPDPPQPRQPG